MKSQWNSLTFPLCKCFFLSLSTTTTKEFTKTIHLKGECDTQSLIKWIGRRGRHDIPGVDVEDIHFESSTKSEVFAVTLCRAFMVITTTKGKLIIVNVFRTDTPLHFFKFALESSFAIAKTLENSGDGGKVSIIR